MLEYVSLGYQERAANHLHLATDSDGVVAGESELGLVIDFDRLHIVKS